MSKRKKHQARQTFGKAFSEEDERLSFNPDELMTAIATRQLESDPDAEQMAAVLVYDFMKKAMADDPDEWVRGLDPSGEDEAIKEFIRRMAEEEADPEDIPILIKWLKDMNELNMRPYDGQHR